MGLYKSFHKGTDITRNKVMVQEFHGYVSSWKPDKQNNNCLGNECVVPVLCSKQTCVRTPQRVKEGERWGGGGGGI